MAFNRVSRVCSMVDLHGHSSCLLQSVLLIVYSLVLDCLFDLENHLDKIGVDISL
jgi:hypothetical protein